MATLDKSSGDHRGPVRILAAANPAYAMPLAVMLVSVACTLDPARRLEIYVIDSGVPAQDRDRIVNSVAANRPGFTPSDIRWFPPDLAPVRDLAIDKHLTVDTYARLLAPYLLPEECDRILYLDCDLVALRDVSEIYDAISDEKIVWAVPDVGVPFVDGPDGIFNYAELGIPAGQRYFNGGVLGLNLKRWRREKVTERVLDYLHRHKDRVHYHDQGGLNAILHDQWAPLDLAWNQCTHPIFHPQIWAAAGYSIRDWKRVRDHAAIVHYTGGDKPWKWRQVNKPRSSFFFRYLDRTAYRGNVRQPPGEKLLGYRLYFLLWSTVRRIVYALRGPPERPRG